MNQLRCGRLVPAACMICLGMLGLWTTKTTAQQIIAQPYETFQLPFDEKPFHPNAAYPSMRVWPFRTPIAGGLEVHTTARSIGPESAMLFYLPKGGRKGTLMIYDGSVRETGDRHDLTTYKGICFWLRGDGGDGEISIGTESNQIRPEYPRIGKFPLSNKQWVKYFVPWDRFSPALKKTGFYFFNIQLEPKTDRACWAVLTRVALYKEEKTEDVANITTEDPPGIIPADQFVKPSVAEAQTMLPKTMAKLKAKQPLTIVVTGPSIQAGAQLWYMNPTDNPRFSDVYIYWARLEELLARQYGYEHHRFVFKNRIYPNKKHPEITEHYEILTGQTPEADGTLPFDGLQIIGVTAGGKDVKFADEHFSDVTQFKPDLVIWAHGGNNVPSNDAANYKTYTTQAIEKLKAMGVEVILEVPTPWTDHPYYDHSLAFREHAEGIAKATHVPLVDQLGAVIARGARYRGDLMSDRIHLNEFGHATLAATLAAALGVPDQVTWDSEYFRALADGAKIPN